MKMNAETKIELKPCPFCGADADIEEIDAVLGVRKSAGCNTETCQGYQSSATFATRREAAEAWNTRAAESEKECLDLMRAAKDPDWMQVVFNQGPPCFHVENGRFCLRTERWDGHHILRKGDILIHKYVSLEDLLRESMR